MRLAVLSLASLLLAGGTAVGAASVSGTWEVQSLGADRQIAIEHKGQRIVAYRVLWPQFDGTPYKLEHLLRGRIVDGKRIQGELLVREEGLAEFEFLREFVGTIDGPAALTIDGLPLKRINNTVGQMPRLKESSKRTGLPGR